MPKQEPTNKHLKDLKKRVASSSQNPGIYRWLDKNGNVIYIGKANNLRNRLRSYLTEPDKSAGLPAEARSAQAGPWKLMMHKQITDFDVTVTNSELEALVLETNLIKENKPKYNVLMKDDKSYLFVQISKEPYPQIEIVRKGVEPNTIGFGPFTGKMDIRKTLDMLHEIIPYKACKKSLETLNRGANLSGEPCLEEQIGECCGLCKGKLMQEEYADRIQNIIKFLKGDRKPAISKLAEEMRKAAENKKFERAAKLRDALTSIERMEEQQLVSDTSGEDMDVIGMSVLNGKAQVVLFKQRLGKVIDELSLTLAGQAESEAQALSQFIPQYYSESPDIPPLIVIGKELDELQTLEEWLREQSGRATELRAAERGNKSKLLALAEKNAHEKLKALETKWEAAAKNTELALTDLKEELNLPDIPKRIECYDISHTSGTETVGSMSVAKNGKAANDQYRHFTIRTLKEGEIDDYKALAEVLKRRLRYLVVNLKEEEAKWKTKGITIGRARKGEQEKIAEIINAEPELSDEDLDYRDFTVARKEKEIIAFVRHMINKEKTQELKSLWVNLEYRSDKLGQFLARKALSKIKKGKVYIIFAPESNLEEYYSEIGFRHIHDAPKILKEKTAKFVVKLPLGRKLGLFMMYDTAKNKADSSLSSKPDLIVIDGGKGQVSTVSEVLKELDLKIPLIGIAKKEEEIFVPNSSHPIPFNKEAQAVFLLMRLRNEAHRFANRLREKKAEKVMIGKL
jgi:excinuclease ABC subunit C